jgi:exopolyphosphatase/pppGpp-phosphohydrolase
LRGQEWIEDHHTRWINYFKSLEPIAQGMPVEILFGENECAADPIRVGAAGDSFYAVYDWGSSGVRFSVFKIEESNNEFPEAIVSVALAFPHEFGQAHLVFFVDAWKALVKSIEALFPTEGAMVHKAIATAGLRSSKIGDSLVDAVNALGVDLKIVSQKEEARLALDALRFSQVSLMNQSMIIWDMGGKSMQWLLHFNNGHFSTIGSDGGLFHFKDYWMRVGGGEMDNRYHLAHAKYTATYFFFQGDDVRQLKGFNRSECSQIKQYLPEAVVYGVGAIHSLYVKHFIETVLEVCLEDYTREELKQVLEYLIHENEEQLVGMAHPMTYANEKHDILLKLVSVLAIMNYLNIDRVIPVGVDNREGLMMQLLEGKIGA